MLRKIVLALLISTGVAWAQHPDDAFVGQKAPELKDGDAWINSPPLKLEQLRGKVVLIDFWAGDDMSNLYSKYLGGQLGTRTILSYADPPTNTQPNYNTWSGMTTANILRVAKCPSNLENSSTWAYVFYPASATTAEERLHAIKVGAVH